MTARTSAYPRRYPRPWLLAGSLLTRHAVGTYSRQRVRARVRLLRSQLPLLASVGRCFPPGFLVVQTGQYRRLPASRWLNHTFAFAAHRCLLDGIPGLRLPGSAVYPRFKPLRTSRRPGGYAFTPAPGERGLHPHGKLSYEIKGLIFNSRSTRKPKLPFDQRVALQHAL
jgi:hypothetical protein